jgi:hypothetical protein
MTVWQDEFRDIMSWKEVIMRKGLKKVSPILSHDGTVEVGDPQQRNSASQIHRVDVELLAATASNQYRVLT